MRDAAREALERFVGAHMPTAQDNLVIASKDARLLTLGDLRAALASPAVETEGWRPMDSAPTDTQPILVRVVGGMAMARIASRRSDGAWNIGGGWIGRPDDTVFRLTGWAPIPPLFPASPVPASTERRDG